MQQLERVRAYERNHRSEVRIISAEWLHACEREQRLVHHDDHPFTGTAVVRPHVFAPSAQMYGRMLASMCMW